MSHAIKSLETELGVQLFEREGRRMRLTAFGKEFATYVKRGLREIDKGVERAQEFNGKLGGTVNIGAVLTVQGDYLPPLFHDFSENYGKEVKLNMFQGFSIPLVEGLENDKYDVVFAAAREQKPNLCYVHVLSHELVLVVNKDNPLAQRDSISISELSGCELHTYRLGTPIGEEVNDLLAEHSLAAKHDCEDEVSLGGIISARPDEMALATLAIGLKAFGHLRFLRIKEVPRDFHPIYLIYKRDAYRSCAAERFIQFTQDWVAPKDAIPRIENLEAGA